LERLFKKARSGIGRNLDVESKTLFKNSSWVFFSNFTGIALNVVRSIVIARGLGASTFGSYAIVVAFVSIVQEFLNLNLGTAIIKFGAAYHHNQRIDKLTALIKESIRVNFIMILVSIAVVTILSLSFYSTLVRRPGLELFIIFYAVAAGTKYFNSISNGVLRLYFRFKLNSTVQIIMDVIETGLVVTAILLYPRDLHVFFFTVILAAFINGFICNWMAYWELRHEFKPYLHVRFDLIRSEFTQMKRFVIRNSLGNSLKALMAQGDVLLLGALAGPAQVGFYSVAKKIGYSILALTDPLMQSVFPQFSKLVAAQKFDETKKMLRKITLLATVPSIVFVFLTLSLKRWLFLTVFGNVYLDAIYPFKYLLLSAVFSSITFWSLPLIVSLGMVRLRIQVYMIAIICGAAIAYYAVPRMHASGMALALFCVNVIINSIFIYMAYRKMQRL